MTLKKPCDCKDKDATIKELRDHIDQRATLHADTRKALIDLTGEAVRLRDQIKQRNQVISALLRGLEGKSIALIGANDEADALAIEIIAHAKALEL